MNKVDLFVPTFNRPKFLKRLLQYYSDKRVGYRFIVVDSSSSANKKINKKIVSEFGDLNIFYTDDYPSSMVSHTKFGRMLKMSRSKYTVFCADDDFIVPSGIDRAVEFLDKNPEYAAAHGRYIAFYIYNFFLGGRKFLWRFIYSVKTISDNSPLTRVCKHIENYNQVLWAVRRTDILRKVYAEFLKSDVSPVLFGELLPDILTAAYGKIKKINSFYSARQAFSTAYSYWPSLQDSKKDGIYDKEYALFRDCLARSIKRLDRDLSLQNIRIRIDRSFEAYLKLSYQEHLMGRVNLFLKKLPSIVSNLIRQLHVVYLYSKRKQDPFGNINSPSSKFQGDYLDIKRAAYGQ